MEHDYILLHCLLTCVDYIKYYQKNSIVLYSNPGNVLGKSWFMKRNWNLSWLRECVRRNLFSPLPCCLLIYQSVPLWAFVPDRGAGLVPLVVAAEAFVRLMLSIHSVKENMEFLFLRTLVNGIFNKLNELNVAKRQFWSASSPVKYRLLGGFALFFTRSFSSAYE